MTIDDLKKSFIELGPIEQLNLVRELRALRRKPDESSVKKRRQRKKKLDKMISKISINDELIKQLEQIRKENR